jgi:AcrR family transcriptional regulator
MISMRNLIGKNKMKKKPKKTNSTANKKKRAYNNTSRAEKSQAHQQEIIQTLVKLLVQNKGGDVTFEEIAQHSTVTVRSIYRFFKDKEELHAAMDSYLLSYLEASTEKIATMDVATFGQTAFSLFDEHESLMMAYLYSPFGKKARVLFRKKFNKQIIQKILQEKKVALTLENKKKLALIVSLINAKIWYDIKTDYQYSGKQMGATVHWALSTLLDSL